MNKILIIDDDEMMRETIVSYLSDRRYTLSTAANGLIAEEIFRKEKPDLVISDVRMPEKDGIELLKSVKSLDSHVPVVLMTAYDDIDSTIRAMQLGAYDYVEKPFDKERLNFLVERALETKHLSQRLEIIDSETVKSKNDYETLIGKSEAMRDIIKNVGRISSSRVTILIQGESGTGKEVVSKFIHYCGATKDEPFIPVNCTALSETLLESELFGHVRGSFTGCTRDKKGKFELAQNGTIFLDEISEISPETQVKLLRIIQEKEFERVGGEDSIPVNARIIAATNRDLYKLVESGKFRKDLFYRLNVFKINVPPLRERKEDIPELVIHLLKEINEDLHKNVFKVPYNVLELLQNHSWSGNVRELKNTLQEAVILAPGDVLEKGYIFLHNSNSNASKRKVEKLPLKEIEKRHIKLILDSVKWDKRKACRILEISRPTLNKKIGDYNITEDNIN
jgi:DNA-binding NtrC family response regulator